MDGALNNINPEKVLYVANFGDPKLYLPEGNRACKNIGISNYRVYAPDCNIKEGILGAIKPYQPDGYYDKLGIWCNKTDFICGSSVNLLKLFDAHTSYNSKDGYDKLAEIIADKTTQKSDITPTTARYSEAEKREIFLIFDHAQFASKKPGEEMKSIEDNLKEKLIEVSEHGTRVGIYNAYSLLSPILVLGEAMPFTNDNVGQKIDEVNIKNNQTDGWVFTDYFNNIYVAIYEAAGSSFWTPGSERNIYVLTNVKHNTYKSVGGFTPQDATLEAKKYGAKISFLSENGNEKNATYEKMARDTGGQLIGNNYSKILLKQMQVEKKSRLSTKTFNINQDTEYTLIIINDLLYGFSKNKTITITDLDEDYDNEIRFVSYDSDGNIKSKKIYNLHPKTIKTPDTSSAI